MRYVIYKKTIYDNIREYTNYYINSCIFTLDINRAHKYFSEREALEQYQYETFFNLFKLEDKKNIENKDIIYIAKIDNDNNIISETKYYKV